MWSNSINERVVDMLTGFSKSRLLLWIGLRIIYKLKRRYCRCRAGANEKQRGSLKRLFPWASWELWGYWHTKWKMLGCWQGHCRTGIGVHTGMLFDWGMAAGAHLDYKYFKLFTCFQTTQNTSNRDAQRKQDEV